jgi:predicted nucleotide-binding protein
MNGNLGVQEAHNLFSNYSIVIIENMLSKRLPYEGTPEGDVLRTIAVEGARFWSGIRFITKLSENQLNNALSNLYADRIITKNSDGSYWILRTEIVRAYREASNKNISESEENEFKRVFIVHGRNSKARTALDTFLRSIGLEPLYFSEASYKTGKGAPYIGEVLETAFSMAKVIIVLMTPDDKAYLQEAYQEPDDPIHEIELTPQARPNVLFEAGMALGQFPDNTILIQLGRLRPFSDIDGRHKILLDNSESKRRVLYKRLESLECSVSLQNDNWKTAGDFETCL